MKIVMKKTALLFSAALTTLLLAACPGVDPGSGTNPKTEEGPPIETPAASLVPVLIPGANRLTLFWTPAQGAETYEVWYGSSGDRGAAVKLDDPVDMDTTAVITGLSGTEPYYVWIQTKNKSGVIGWSRAASAKLARVFDTGVAGTFNVDLPSYIRGEDGGSPDNPVPVAISGDLGAENYKRLLTMIKRAEKYVALDLGGVTGSGSGAGFRTGGIFDPVVPEGTESMGAAKIAALILPDDTVELKTGATVAYLKSLFNQYTGLRYFFAGGPLGYSSWGGMFLFSELAELRGVSLPVLEYLPNMGNFSGCTNLVTVSMPALLNLSSPPAPEDHFTQAFDGSCTFNGCPNLELVTLSAEIEMVNTNNFGKVCVKARMNLAGEGNAQVLAGGKALITRYGKYMTMAPSAAPYRLDLMGADFKRVIFNGDGFISALVLPASVTSIGFKDCVNLKELTIYRAEPPSGSDPFSNTPGDLVIRVPASRVGDYQSAWPGKDIRPIP